MKQIVNIVPFLGLRHVYYHIILGMHRALLIGKSTFNMLSCQVYVLLTRYNFRALLEGAPFINKFCFNGETPTYSAYLQFNLQQLATGCK